MNKDEGVNPVLCTWCQEKVFGKAFIRPIVKGERMYIRVHHERCDGAFQRSMSLPHRNSANAELRAVEEEHQPKAVRYMDQSVYDAHYVEEMDDEERADRMKEIDDPYYISHYGPWY